MAEEWRKQIIELLDALGEDRCDPHAREAVRSMVEEIRLTPRDGVLAIDVKRNLAAMLGAASQPRTGSAKSRWLRGRVTSGTCSSGARGVKRGSVCNIARPWVRSAPSN